MKHRKQISSETQLSPKDPAHDGCCVSSEAIACRAHERYVQRGGGHGQDLEDWLAAERELREELANKH